MICALSGHSINVSGLSDGEVGFMTADGIARVVRMANADAEYFLNHHEETMIWCVERYSQDHGSSLWGGVSFDGRARFLSLIKIQRMQGRVAVELAHENSLLLLSMGDPKRLSKIPGLGAKMIPQVLEHIKDYPKLFRLNEDAANVDFCSGHNSSQKQFSDQVRHDLDNTLLNLGYTKAVDRKNLIRNAESIYPGDALNATLEEAVKFILVSTVFVSQSQ